MAEVGLNFIEISEINDNYVYPEIYNFWERNKNLWFSGITITDEMNSRFISSRKDYDKNNLRDNICKILQYDQIIRHYPYRYNMSNTHLTKSTNMVKRILENKEINIFDNEVLKQWERIFMYLVLRHNKNLEMKYLSLEYINKEEITPLSLRFLRATVTDISEMKCKDGIERFNVLNEPTPSLIIDYNEFRRDNYYMLDKKCGKYPDLEYLTPENNIKRIRMKNNKFVSGIKKVINILNAKKPIDKICVSISGGVDSMILSYYLTIVLDIYYPLTELCMVHMSYMNRDKIECEKEIEMIIQWALFLSDIRREKNKVKAYVRVIDEIKRKRNTKYRAVYEEVTRKMRYKMYELVDCPIFMGHNRDDCIENIFSNISKSVYFENLKGMSCVTDEAVVICRPFLEITKDEIYREAEKYDIPFLRDSTPEWSSRGKMRDKLVPMLNSYDERIINGIVKTSEILEHVYNEWVTNIVEWGKKTIEYGSITDNKNNEIGEGYIIQWDDIFRRNFIRKEFWIIIFYRILNEDRPSNKSIENLVSHLNTESSKNTCILNKNYTIKWRKNREVYLFVKK